MEEIVDLVLKGALIFCALMVFICFIRACMGPTIPDRLLAVNMIGTQIIIMIAILTVLLKEAWLADVAVVYALISFLGVVVLTKIYIGIYRKKLASEMSMEEGKKVSAAKKGGRSK